MGRPKANKPRNAITNVRLTEEERTSFDEMAAQQGFANVSRAFRLVGSIVPYHDCAATVFPFGYDTFKLCVIDRVILYMHCQTFDSRI